MPKQVQMAKIYFTFAIETFARVKKTGYNLNSRYHNQMALLTLFLLFWSTEASLLYIFYSVAKCLRKRWYIFLDEKYYREKQARQAHYKWWLKHFAKVDVAFKVSTQQRKGLGFCE